MGYAHHYLSFDFGTGSRMAVVTADTESCAETLIRTGVWGKFRAKITS